MCLAYTVTCVYHLQLVVLLCTSLWKWKSLNCVRLLATPWNFPGQNTGVGSLSLFRDIFPTQESNPCLPHCRRILYQLSHKGSPIGLAMPSLDGKYYDKVYIIGVHHLMGSIFISSKLWNICTHKKYTNIIKSTDGLSEGENRQNRLHLESRTPSWAGLWTLSYMPSIYGNDIPTGKPDPTRWKNPSAHT